MLLFLASSSALYLAFSEDCRNWNVQQDVLLEDVRSADAVMDPDTNQIRAYLETDTGIKLILSEDNGATWTDPIMIKVDGPLLRQPTVAVDDESGTLLFGIATNGGQTNRLLGATSTDGRSFSTPIACIDLRHGEFPEVITDGGGWVLLFSRDYTVHRATSDDGMAFDHDVDFASPGGTSPGALRLADGRVRIFQSARSGIWSQTTIGWATIVKEPGFHITPTDGSTVQDPSPVRLADGTYLMLLVSKWNAAQIASRD